METGTEYVITIHEKGDPSGHAMWGRLWMAPGTPVSSDEIRVQAGYLIQDLLKALYRA